MIKVSPYIGLTVLLFGLNYKAKGQNINLFGKPYFLSNPAYSMDSGTYVNIFALNTFVQGNRMSLGYGDLLKLDQQMLREGIIGVNQGSSGWINTEIIGPSISFPLGEKNRLSFFSALQVLGHYDNLDGRLVAEVNESHRFSQTYPYDVATKEKMMTNVASWSKFGLGFSRNIYSKQQHKINLGLNVYYIKGVDHSSVDVDLQGGEVDLAPSYITGSSGTISTTTAGAWFNQPGLSGVLKGRGSWGGDIGISYQYKKESDKDYTLKAGITVNNFGQVKYTSDSTYSKDFDITLENTRLYFNQQRDDFKFNRIANYLEENENAFKKTNARNEHYQISLPTSLNLFVDYRFTNKLGLLARANTSLTEDKSIDQLYHSNDYGITPYYTDQQFGVALPVSYREYSKYNAGIHVELGGFSIASESAISSILKGTDQIDVHLGARFTLNKKNKSVEGRINTSISRPHDNTIIQNPNIKSFISLSAIATSNNTVPFWMRSMQYGSIPLSGLSTSLEAGMTKNYSSSKKDQLFDWGAGAEARFNVGYTTQAILVEAYAKARLGVFQLKAGRSKDMMGLVDSTLSTGAFAISGNALGIPKVELSIPEYCDVPLSNGLIAVKGNFAHGWMGEQRINTDMDGFPVKNEFVNSYLHQKSLYARLGKTKWRVKLHGGFNHQAMWGNEDEITNHTLSTLETYKYVFTGTAYHPDNFPGSKIGNHLGSLDQAIEIDFNKFSLMAYHQFFYEAGALAYLDNINDGITGLSYTNKTQKYQRKFRVKKALLEFIYSKSQGGEVDSKGRASAAEDYYNNFLYNQGWSFHQENIGNVLFTSNKYLRNELPKGDIQYFTNNRVVAVHCGGVGEYKKWILKSFFTWSNNFGTYATAPASKGRGNEIYYNSPPYFGKIGQFSGYLEASKQLKNGFRLTLITAIDQGSLLYNSIGGIVKLSKTL
ncbi:DUF5723 family protein [Labilibacter marinus]|uniref:DUF5723 family protein n=1 Tax=Labilibacter marinus TaxID=1477105 RepID=UPI0009F972B2|nr:capsule assembly Wzi family protein [Labilibacter marinus]